jgi:hypothetical protein
MVITVEEAMWAPGPVLMGMEKRKFLAPTGVRTPDHLARCKCLHQLCYPGPKDLSATV